MARLIKHLLRRAKPDQYEVLRRLWILGHGMGKLGRNILPHVENLVFLLQVLSGFRSRKHIRELREIHQLVLHRNWSRRNTERMLYCRYFDALGGGTPRDALRRHECKVYTQNGEDGLILHFLSKIGAPTRTYVNIGGGGLSSNSANLVLNYGWRGIEIDGSAESLETFRNAYLATLDDGEERVKVLATWITRENVNDIIRDAGISGEIDLLSVDIDGNDYWIWDALEVVNPRLVVMEYNAFFGLDRAITVQYYPEFDRRKKHFTTWYAGASLTAMARLAKRKGYALVGCESNGVNAFFVRRDLMGPDLAELLPEEAYYPHSQHAKRITPEGLRELLNEMPYDEV